MSERERKIDVIYGRQRKRMNLKLQPLDEVKKTLRKRFEHQLGGDFSIKATLAGQEDEYDITNDDDLQDLFDELVKLRLDTNLTIVPFTRSAFTRDQLKCVEIDGVIYQLDAPMPEDSPLVEQFIEEYGLGEFISETKGLAWIINVSFMATKSSGEIKLINEMHDVGCSIAQVINHTRSLMSGYVRASSQVLAAFRYAILSMYENHRKKALQSYARVGEFVDESNEYTKKIIDEIDGVSGKIDQLLNTIGDDRIQEELQEAEIDIKKKSRELSRKKREQDKIEADIAETEKRENARRKQDEKATENVSAAAKARAVGFYGAAGSGVVGGAVGLMGVDTLAPLASVCRGAFIVAVPAFLLGKIAHNYLKSEQERLEEERQVNCEEIHRQSSEKKKVEQKLIELEETVKQLGDGFEASKNLLKCLERARECIRQIKVPLGKLQLGWQEVGTSCKNINESKDSIDQILATDDCTEVMKTRAFKEQVVHDFARWVALKVFARRCNESLKAEGRTWENRLQLYTQQQAFAELKALKHSDFLQLTYPE